MVSTWICLWVLGWPFKSNIRYKLHQLLTFFISILSWYVYVYIHVCFLSFSWDLSSPLHVSFKKVSISAKGLSKLQNLDMLVELYLPSWYHSSSHILFHHRLLFTHTLWFQYQPALYIICKVDISAKLLETFKFWHIESDFPNVDLTVAKFASICPIFQRHILQ